MANNPELLKMPLARDGQKSTIPETTDASTGLFSQQYGWQSINSLPPQAGGKAVKREDFNGAFNLLGGVAFMAQKGFTFKWSAEQDYYAGCVVIDDTDGLRYECIADVTANGTAPSADSTHWQTFGGAGTDLDAWFRQPSTVYAVGDIRCYESLPYGWYLDCTTAGTTGSGDITIPSPLTEKDTVADGTVTWTIRKIGSGGDGVPLGAILPLAHNSTVPAGYLLCDGAAVSRTMYSDLFSVIGTTYGAGDGSTTFNVPDYNAAKRFAQGDTVAGTVKQPGLPNITGSTNQQYSNSDTAGWHNTTGADLGTGALYIKGSGSPSFTKQSAWSAYTSHPMAFDASRSNAIYGASNTVQPPALTTRYIIKAFDDQTPDSALIDITQYANELATKANRQLSNLDTANLACHVVVDSYYDSTTGDWWRKYDDGWVEQGGRSTYTYGVTTTITLLKPFNGTKYDIQVSDIYLGSNVAPGSAVVDNLTTTGFEYLRIWAAGGTNDIMWMACGMGAQS